MRVRDQSFARIFLCLSFVAGLSLAIECSLGRLGLYSGGFLLLICWWVSGRIASAAFQDMDKEISPENSEARPALDFYLAGVVFLIAASHLLFFLYEAQGRIWIRNINLNGDLPFHWHQILYLARTESLWPANPIYAADHLRYAFGVNWLSALLLRAGLPFEAVLTLPLFLAAYAVFQQLWKWAGLWAVVAFFASGGGWWLPLGSWESLWGPGDILAWKNLFLSIFVTQRGFWLALPLGIFWLRFLLELQRNPWLASPEKWRMLFALWAFLPFFHLHSFVFLSLFGAALVLSGPLRADWRRIFLQGLWWAWIPLLFLLKSISFGNASSSVHWARNWMSDKQDLWLSLGLNFGPWLFFVVFLFVALLFRFRVRGQQIVRDNEEKPLLLWGLFALLFFHLMLAPWNWDQTKILLWIYLGLSVTMGQILTRILPRTVVLVLLALMHLPGLFQLVGGLGPRMGKMALWRYEDQQAVRQLVLGLKPDERVLVAPSPHHPIFSTGQPIVAGYMGHLWSHGLSIGGLEEHLKVWVRAPQTAAQQTGPWAQMRAEYLLWGPLEREWAGIDQPGSDVGGTEKWLEVARSGNWVLYKLSHAEASTQ